MKFRTAGQKKGWIFAMKTRLGPLVIGLKFHGSNVYMTTEDIRELPAEDLSKAAAAIQLLETAVVSGRPRVEDSPYSAADRIVLATSLVAWSAGLTGLGRWDEALEALEEARSHYFWVGTRGGFKFDGTIGQRLALVYYNAARIHWILHNREAATGQLHSARQNLARLNPKYLEGAEVVVEAVTDLGLFLDM